MDLMQRIKPSCLFYKTKAGIAASITRWGVRRNGTSAVMMEIDGCLKLFLRNVSREQRERRTSGLWSDHMAPGPVSAFPCPTPWITALWVISSATAEVFELEIYSSAFLILIGGGCLLVFSFSSRILSLIRKQHGKPQQCFVSPLS